jgi:hypothetical protein
MWANSSSSRPAFDERTPPARIIGQEADSTGHLSHLTDIYPADEKFAFSFPVQYEISTSAR